jgi:hypothetical protein
MNTCQTCRYFKTGIADAPFGRCTKGIVAMDIDDDILIHTLDTRKVYGGPLEQGVYVEPLVGPEFGCIHHDTVEGPCCLSN